MKGFTSFVKEEPSQAPAWNSWFGKKEADEEYVVVTKENGTWDDILSSSPRTQSPRDGVRYDQAPPLPEHDAAKADAAPTEQVAAERERLRHQRTGMKDWWVADKMAKQCYECRQSFGVLTRKHHCRVCGQIFCHKCSDNFLPGHRVGFPQGTHVRLCQCCFVVWQSDKKDTVPRPAPVGPVSSKAQGIARQVSTFQPRQRAASDTRNNPSPSSPARATPPHEAIQPQLTRGGSTLRARGTGGLTASCSLPRGVGSSTAMSELDSEPRDRSLGATSSPPSRRMGLRTRSFNHFDVAAVAAAPAGAAAAAAAATADADERAGKGAPAVSSRDCYDIAESTLLSFCLGPDDSRVAQWRAKIAHLTEERLQEQEDTDPLDKSVQADHTLICPVSELPDEPSLLPNDDDDYSDLDDDELTTHESSAPPGVADDAAARQSINAASHAHLHNLVYRLLADLIVTGTDMRGLQPEDDVLVSMTAHLEPIIRRALWAAPDADEAASPVSSGAPGSGGPGALYSKTPGPRDSGVVPPEDGQHYSHNAAAVIAGALFGLEVAKTQDLDLAVVQAVRNRPDNNPESLVCLILTNPMLSHIIEKNENAACARHFENNFIESHSQEFALSDGIEWVRMRYGVTEDEALECIELLYKRGAIVSDLPEQLVQSYRERLGVKKFGEPAVTEVRASLDRKKVYSIVRGASTIEEDLLSVDQVRHMLSVFRDDFSKDDMRTVNIAKWTKVICRLAWKAATTILPCVWKGTGDVMDIREFMKVIPIPGGDPWDSEYVCGTVIPGHLANRNMPTTVWNPRVLLLGDQIDYERTSVATDFSTLVQGTQAADVSSKTQTEGTWLEQLSARVEVMRPDVVFVERSVNLRVQDRLCAANISLATSVSKKCFERVKKATQADVVSNLPRIPIHYLKAAGGDHDLEGAPKLGHCQLFTARTVGDRPLMYLCGGDDEKGCAIILRGGTVAVLKRLKTALKFAAFVAHNLLLESNYLNDSNACLLESPYNGAMPGSIDETFSPVDSEHPAAQDFEALASRTKDFNQIRNSTELLSSSLCVDFDLPDVLAKKKERPDKVRPPDYLDAQHLQQMPSTQIESDVGSPDSTRGFPAFDAQRPKTTFGEAPPPPPPPPPSGPAPTDDSATAVTASNVGHSRENSVDLSMMSMSATFSQLPLELRAQHKRKRGKEQLVQLCRDLCYLNPNFHQSIMVHDTQTEINVDTQSNKDNTLGGQSSATDAASVAGTLDGPPPSRRDRSQSIYDDASRMEAERRASVFHRPSTVGVTLSCKDLASQAHQFGFGHGTDREAADDGGAQVSKEGGAAEGTRTETLRMPGGTAKFKKLLIEYYKIGKNKGSDIPFVCYLAEHFNIASSSNSTTIMSRQYSHNKGRLTVTSEKTDEMFSCDYVVMWSYCKKCCMNVTPRVECSMHTMSYSFGKFLETSFYNFKAVSRKCGHSLHGDLVRYFGQRVVMDDSKKINVQVKFDYQPVDVFKLKFPEMECYYDPVKFGTFVSGEETEVIEAVKQGYQSVQDSIDELEGYQVEHGVEDPEDIAALRNRCHAEAAAVRDAVAVCAEQNKGDRGAALVMELNRVRKSLYASLQGWSKELTERILAVPQAEDRKEQKARWKNRFASTPSAAVPAELGGGPRRRSSHHRTTSSFDLQDPLGPGFEGEGSRGPDEVASEATSAAISPAPEGMPILREPSVGGSVSVASVGGGPRRKTDARSPTPSDTPTVPADCARSPLNSPMNSPTGGSTDTGTRASTPGVRPACVPPAASSVAADDAASTSCPAIGDSPTPGSPVRPPGYHQHSQQDSFDFASLAASAGVESPCAGTPAGPKEGYSSSVYSSLTSRKQSLSATHLAGQPKRLLKEANIVYPKTIGGTGVVLNLATGVDVYTVIVRLDEPTSVIAHTLCCEQYRRACQPTTPPLSPAMAGAPRYRQRQQVPRTTSPNSYSPTPPDTPDVAPSEAPSLQGGGGHSAVPSLRTAFSQDNVAAFNLASSQADDPSSFPGMPPTPSSRADEMNASVSSMVVGRPRAQPAPYEASQDAPPHTLKQTRSRANNEADTLAEVLGEKMRRVEIKEFEEVNSWADSKGKHQPCLRFACIVFCSRQFAALRQYYCKGDESNLLASLSRCQPFAPTGGKTGAHYFKTFDDRFVLKAIKHEEVQHFENSMAKKYFEYMSRAIKKRMPTLLVKILGVFKITTVRREEGGSTHQVTNNWMLMENLFYNRKVDRMFDLKGSTRNRFQVNKQAVLLDENLLHLLRDGEWLFTNEESKETLTMGVHNDTLMLRRNSVMDYSMLLGVDDEAKEIYVGIIDYMREYDMKKQLEFLAKYTVAGRQQPTVVDPNKYKERFRSAMNNYFLMLPNKATPWVIKHKKYQTLTDPGSELVFDPH